MDQPASRGSVPADDAATSHLTGRRLPALELAATDGSAPAMPTFGSPWGVLYLYPMTAVPGVDLPGDWDEIPGARGCTPEACSFRDHHADLRAVGAEVVGVSVQAPAEQAEAVERLGLPYPLLSDPTLALGGALDLPTFHADDGIERYQRLTIVARTGVIEHVFHPVSRPGEHATEVLDWLRSATNAP
jgi:peroxiredoxin